MPNALITLFDKSQIEILARPLHEMGWTLYGSAGTAKYLQENVGVPAIDVATIIGAGPSQGHLVVTLSREVALGLITPDTPGDRISLGNLPFFDLYCASYYPLLKTVEKEGGAKLEEVIKNTDVGGPSNAWAAGKGQRWVIIDPMDYGLVVTILQNKLPVNVTEAKRMLIAKMAAANAEYAGAIARYYSQGVYYVQVLESLVGRVETFSLGRRAPIPLSPRRALSNHPGSLKTEPTGD